MVRVILELHVPDRQAEAIARLLKSDPDRACHQVAARGAQNALDRAAREGTTLATTPNKGRKGRKS